MKKSKSLVNILIVIVALAIISVIIIKFIIPRFSASRIEIKNPTEIELISLDGGNFRFSELTKNDFDNYILFLEMDNCPSCIYKGFQDLDSLSKEGEYCFVVAVHDYIDDIKGWAENYNFPAFYVMKKISYYQNINFNYMPILIKYRKGKVKSFRYITN